MSPKRLYYKCCWISKCTVICVQITTIILLHCLSCSSGGNGSVFPNFIHRPRNAYQGCVFGCLYPNMSVQYLLQGRHVSGNMHFENETHIIPQWTNHTLFKLGQKFGQDNMGFLGLSHLYALIFDNFLPDVKHILLATGTTSSPEGAAKRFTATATQVVLWYQNSLDDPQQKRVLLDSLHQVRRRHNDAALKVLNKFKNKDFLTLSSKERIRQMQKDKPSIFNDLRFWTAFQDDLKYSHIPQQRRKYPPYTFEGLPVNQFTHALTQFSFAGMAVLYRRQLGMMHVSEEELRGYVHFWGVIGHALGVKDEFNICMQASLEETTQLFQSILEEIAMPALFQMDETSHIQISAYLDGLLIMNPMITQRFIVYRFLRDIAQVRPLRMQRQLNIVERFNVAGMDGLLSDNLIFNKWLINSNGVFFVDVNGYKYFGGNYTTEERKSKSVFYTREKVAF